VNEDERALVDLPAQSVGRLLESLARLRERRDAGEKIRVPHVTLHLRSGRDVSGFVLKLGTSPGPDVNVLMHAPGSDPRSPDYDAVYVPAASIEAVTVHNAPRQATSPADAGPAPSRLQVKRKVQELADGLSKALGSPVTCTLSDDVSEGEPLRGVEEMLADLSDVLYTLAAEELGARALRERLRAVLLTSSAHPAVDASAQLLTVTAAASPVQRMSKEQLKAAIERMF
jgi:hypothetical protein